jgi:predicted secreted Zn-dependent protease
MLGMHFLVALLAALLVAGCAATVPPVPEPQPSTDLPAALLFEAVEVLQATPAITVQHRVWLQPYSVTGQTASEVRASLNERGPYLDSEGRRYDGQTRWSLELYPRRQSSGSGCRLTATTIDLREVIELPELAGAEGQTPAVLDRWSQYRTALEQHERGHVERHYEVVRGLSEAILALEPAKDCGSLQDQLHSLKLNAIAAMQVADADYDLRTGHGAMEGATFP